MFDAPVPAGRAPVTTPGWLLRSAGLILALTLLAAAGSLWTASRIGDAARTIGRDAEPSVALALRMQATLSDMDAAVLADSLTDNAAASGTSIQYNEAARVLAADLVEAARNITYGEAEAGPLRDLQRTLLAYQQAVVEARYIGRDDPFITARRVQWASRVNRDMAVPQAQALAAANADQLEQRYARYRATSLAVGGAACLAFVLLAASSIVIQAWLARRVRRLLNPALAAGTLLAVLAGAWLATAVLTERADLRAAKSDAYDSLHVLYEAKGQANAIRAAMSLWLLDRPSRSAAQAGIDAASHALIGTDLAKPDQVQPLRAGLQAALALEQQGRPAEALAAALHPGGLLGTELDNVTFGPPERDAATESVARLYAAETLVRAVQAQDDPQNHVFAVARWLGAQPGGGAHAFAQVQAALDRTITVNQDAFDQRVASALRTAALIPAVTLSALALAAALSLGGLWLRLREYR